jgi:glutamate synthase (NADPH/NADH) small chain
VSDPRGFLQISRRIAPYRPVAERLGDHRDLAGPVPAALAVEQAGRCMGCGVPFCHSGCPLGNLVPDWNELVRLGRWREAADALHATNNFPELTGKLCPAPCEEACVLSLNDDPVTIKQIELAIAERAFAEGWAEPRPADHASGRRIAVIGSGPAGLAAAQQLARAGHAVTVFERDERAGGLLRFGIPDYKLEKSTVDRRLDQLEREGVRFELGVEAGIAPTLEQLRAEHDAVLLATGAQRHRDLELPGRELGGVALAMDYLTDRNRELAGLPRRGAVTAAGRHVAILGGGDTSADCLGNALREGALSVTEVAHGPMPPASRSPQETWPAWPRLLRDHPVHHEGGERRWGLETVRFEGEHGRVAAIAGTPADGGPAERLPAGLVLLAIGFAGVEAGPLTAAVRVGPRGTVSVDRRHTTSLPGVFAAGDCVLGADLIVSAIAQGRAAAAAIDGWLQTASPALSTSRTASRAARPGPAGGRFARAS